MQGSKEAKGAMSSTSNSLKEFDQLKLHTTTQKKLQ
jgi:hypothetical protein